MAIRDSHRLNTRPARSTRKSFERRNKRISLRAWNQSQAFYRFIVLKPLCSIKTCTYRKVAKLATAEDCASPKGQYRYQIYCEPSRQVMLGNQLTRVDFITIFIL